MWIISLHVSSPGIWRMDQHDGMEEWSHGDMSLEKHCHGLGSAKPLTGGFPVSEPHTWHGVWSVKNWGYKCFSSCTKNRDSFKAKVFTGEKYWLLMTSICVFRVLLSRPCFLWVCEVRDLRQDFQKKNKWMNSWMNTWMNSLLEKAQYVLTVKTTHQGFLDSFLSVQVNILWKELISSQAQTV